jgi:hypothetical protein
MLACDSSTVETLSLRRFYVLFFIELESRRVHLAGCTTNPTGAWVTPTSPQPQLHGCFERVRFLIRDRDSKFTGRSTRCSAAKASESSRRPCAHPSERPRRAVRPHCPYRVSRLAPHPRPPPLESVIAELHPALQHRAPAPWTRADFDHPSGHLARDRDALERKSGSLRDARYLWVSRSDGEEGESPWRLTAMRPAA